MKRHLIALGVAVTAPLAGAVAMTVATAAVAHAILTGTVFRHPQNPR